MGVRTADECAPDGAGQRHVVNKAAGAAQKTHVLAASQRFTDVRLAVF